MMKTPFFKLILQKIHQHLQASVLFALPIGASLALLPHAAQAGNTWTGGAGGAGTSWNDPLNWGGTMPATTGPVYFTSTGTSAGKVISLDASQTIYSLNFNSYSNVPNFTIGSAADNTAGYTLTLTNVYRGDNNGNTQTIAASVKLAADSLWNIINGYNGSVSVSGSIGSNSAVTFTKEGSNTLTASGNNTFTGGVRVFGGSLVLSGTNAYAGNTQASGGNLTLSFGSATTTNILNSGSTLVLGGARGGGSLTVNGRNLANVVNSQTFNGLTLNNGASGMSIVNGIASGKTLVALGAITRNAGSTINFAQPTINTTISAQNGYTTSTGNDASGILGAYATVGGTDWATNNGTNIVAYTGYTVLSGATPNIVDGATTNIRISSGSTGDVGQAAGTVTVNTINANDASARIVTVGAGNTLRLGAIGGVLSTGTNGVTIGASGNAGTLTAGGADNTAGELILNNSTALTVNSVIADNGTGTVSVTKSGAGTATLAATNTYTGTTTVNAGTLAVTAGSTNPLATTGAITVNGGTFNLGASTSQTTSGAVVIAGGTLSNGTLTKSGANYDVRGGTISTKLAGTAGLDKTTSGTLTFTNAVANTYSGTTTISEGSVVGSATNVVSVSGDLVVGTADGSGSGASFNNNGSNINFSSAKNVTVYSNGSVNFGSGAQNLNGTITINGGTVSGGQIYLFGPVVMTGGTYAGAGYGGNTSFTINASDSTATISGGLQKAYTFNVAEGAAATDLAFTGTMTGANGLTKSGTGKMVASGNSSHTGGTTINAGILQLGNGGTTGKLGTSGAITNNGNLTINRSNAVAQGTDFSSAAITGSGSFSQDGTGITTLNAVNTYSGATTVNAGTLVISGTGSINNTSGVTVNSGGTFRYDSSTAFTRTLTLASGGTLAGSGNLGTVALSIGSGVTLAPGNSPGTLATGTQTWLDGGNYNWQLLDTATGAGTGYDTIAITGGLDLASLTGATDFNINLWTLASIGPDVSGNAANFNPASDYSWTIVSTTTGITGFNAANFTINPTANNGTAGFSNTFDGTFSVDVSGNNLVLNYTAVPEPATWGLLAFSLTSVLVLRRRKA